MTRARSFLRLAAKGWVVAFLAVWTAAVGVLAVVDQSGTGTTVLLLTLGVLLTGLLEAHRRTFLLLRRLEARLKPLDPAQAAQPKAAARVAELAAQVEALAKDSVTTPVLKKALSETAADVITRTRRGVAVDLLMTYRQVEALQNLYAVTGVDRPMPQTRGWACSPDLLLLLAGLVEREKPGLIVECGSGTSTVWLAMVLRRFELKSRIVSLEHLETFADTTRALVDRHGLAEWVEVRHAPLQPVEVGGKTYQWYAREGWSDLDGIDLLFVDGPPAEPGSHARMPAFPLLRDRLHPDAVVVLDDMIRTDEQEILAEWLRTHPGYAAERVRLEKNAALVRRCPEFGPAAS